MPLSWKYSKEKLAKYLYCTHIVRMKKIICHCDKVIKLGHHYDETFLNIHVNSKGCLAKQGVHAEEWESDDDEKMNNDSFIIHEYISHTPAQFGGTRRIEVIAKEIFLDLFPKEFSSKKLDCSQKHQLNCQLYAEAVWKIDHDYNKSNTTSDIWIKLAEKGVQGAFNKKPVFEGLCNIMLQAVIRKEKNMSKRNLKYTDEFKNFLDYRSNSEDMLTDPTLSMTDNTKLKLRLLYSSLIGYIIGSTFANNETNIKIYNNISVIINKIKENNVVAKYIRVYILQVLLPKFPSVIIALLPNLGFDKTETILNIHKLLLDFAQELKLYIISIGSDSAQVEFNAQTQLQQISTPNECKKQLSFINMVEIETSNNTISADFGGVIFATKNTKTNSTRTINLTSINPNQASYMKINQKSISQFIADLYEKELLNKQKTLFSDQNLIKNANINYNNSLNEQDYVIAYYRTQLCIGQVISSFYEAYGYHSYNQEPITDIKNILYLILKVFTPIHNIFSAKVEEGHVLITHQCPKNILYHLDIQDIQIFDNTLQLLEKAKA
ncbi:14494_t:CDS:10, partial [Gigaspora margarita]